MNRNTLLVESGDNLTQNKPIKQKDLATISIYGLSLISAGLFLFLPLVNSEFSILPPPTPTYTSRGVRKCLRGKDSAGSFVL